MSAVFKAYTPGFVGATGVGLPKSWAN